MKDLRAPSKAIIYFEPCFQALSPSHRVRGNFFCKQNYTENPYLRLESIGHCFEIISDMRGIMDVKEVIHHNRMGGFTRYYAWNLTNLSWKGERQKIEGTVEYCNPSYANVAGACLVWMELALRFASAARKAARKVADRGIKIGRRISRELRDFLEYVAVEWTHRSDYERLFTRPRL